MAEEGLSKFEIMQRKMAAKQRKREEARKSGGPSSLSTDAPKKKRSSGSSGGGGGGADPSEAGLSKFELMQKRMADKQKKREEAKKKGGGGGGVSFAPGTGGGGDSKDSKSGGSVHRKAMTTKINMDAVREMEGKNDSESEEEQRNEPWNKIGSRRETSKKNAKLRGSRADIEVLPSSSRHTMDRELSKGDAVIFYSRADQQYIPGVVDSIQKSGRETFYKLEKKYKSSFDPVLESKRLGKKVTMDDDPDRYRRTDKPALIKKDTYFTILTNNDFDVELRLAMVRLLRDKMKATLAKHKKRDEKRQRINKIVSNYGTTGGGNYAGNNYDEPPAEPKKEKKTQPKMSKSKTTLKVHDVGGAGAAGAPKLTAGGSNKGKKSKKHAAASSTGDAAESVGGAAGNLSVGSRKANSRTKSTNTLPGPEKLSDAKKKGKRSKSPQQGGKDEKGGKDTKETNKKEKGAKGGKAKSKGKRASGAAAANTFANLVPTSDVSEWTMGDISKWLMYLSNSPFVPPDDDDSDADEYDEDEIEMMAKKKSKLFDKYFQHFVAAQIDGPKLLKLNKKALSKTCNVKNGTDRNLLYMAIKDLKNGKIGGGATGAGPSDSESNNNNSSNNNDESDEKQEEWKPLQRFDKKPSKMKKTVTVMNTVSSKPQERPTTARKEVALRVGGGGYKTKAGSSRGPKRPVSARRDQGGKSPAKRFNDSDDDGDESDHIESESPSDEDQQPLTYQMMNGSNNKKRNSKNSKERTAKLGGWDSDSD